MKKYRHIDKKINSTIALRILLTILCIAAFVLIAWSMVDSLYSKPKFQYATYAVCGLLCLLVIYKIGLVQLLLDSEWRGKVISVKARDSYDVKLAARSMQDAVYIDITVMTDSGKEKEFSYNMKSMTEDYYKEGMRVVHKRGCEYLIHEELVEGKVICPICGRTLFDTSCNICRIELENKD